MSKDFEKAVVFSALEVANICGVANQTAINWIKNGYLEAYSTPGGQYRVYADDLISFMESRNIRLPKMLLDYVAKKTNSKILIVEDEIGLNTVIKQYFEKNLSNVDVFQAFDGFEAGTLISTKKPDVIILDLNLPGVNGFDLCRKINQTDSFGNPAIIIITALQDSEIEKQIEEIDSVCFFRKPIVLSELMQAVKNCKK